MIPQNSIVTWTGAPADLLERALSVVAYLGKAMREADEAGWPKDAVEAAGTILTDVAHASASLATANPKAPVTIAPFYEGGEAWVALQLIWPVAQHMGARRDGKYDAMPNEMEVLGADLLMDAAVKILKHYFDLELAKNRRIGGNGGGDQ